MPSLDSMMMREIIMDHYENPRNHGLVDDKKYDSVNMDSETCIDNIDVQALVEEYGDATRPEWKGKILGIGSPKLDATNLQTANIDLLPESWKQKLYKADGSRKKVIFYNTSMGAFLENSQAMLLKILDVFQVFKAQQEETVLLWRPHPLMLSTIQSMRPELTAIYQQLVQQYLKDDFGIYDDTPDLHRSLALADAYYGDHSSLVKICKEANIPVMIQNVNVLTNLS